MLTCKCTRGRLWVLAWVLAGTQPILQALGGSEGATDTCASMVSLALEDT